MHLGGTSQKIVFWSHCVPLHAAVLQSHCHLAPEATYILRIWSVIEYGKILGVGVYMYHQNCPFGFRHPTGPKTLFGLGWSHLGPRKPQPVMAACHWGSTSAASPTSLPCCSRHAAVWETDPPGIDSPCSCHPPLGCRRWQHAPSGMFREIRSYCAACQFTMILCWDSRDLALIS